LFFSALPLKSGHRALASAMFRSRPKGMVPHLHFSVLPQEKRLMHRNILSSFQYRSIPVGPGASRNDFWYGEPSASRFF